MLNDHTRTQFIVGGREFALRVTFLALSFLKVETWPWSSFSDWYAGPSFPQVPFSPAPIFGKLWKTRKGLAPQSVQVTVQGSLDSSLRTRDLVSADLAPHQGGGRARGRSLQGIPYCCTFKIGCYFIISSYFQFLEIPSSIHPVFLTIFEEGFLPTSYVSGSKLKSAT